MIQPKGMLQISVVDLENGIGLDPSGIGFYTIDIDDPINDYVQLEQHYVNDNLFTD